MKSPSLTGHRSPTALSFHALLLASIGLVGGEAEGQSLCFDAPFVLPTDSDAAGIATADFDGDGILDLAIADGSLAIARGVGDGTFHPGVHIGPGGPAPDAAVVVSGDFEGDGDVDIAVSYFQSFTLTLFSNGGTGSFTTSTFSVPVPDLLTLLDFDGDLDLDVAAGGYGSVAILRNTGGTFAPFTTLTFTFDGNRMISGDFDGNGADEIVLSALNATTLSHVSFVGGQFVSNPIPATIRIRELTACDLDGDGDLDIVASDTSTTVLLNTGAGVFAAPVSYPASDPSIIIPVDLDGNGLSDVAIVSPYSDSNLLPQTIDVRMATGGGSLSAPTSYPVGNLTGRGIAGDFDGDGNMDLALTDGRGCVRIFRGMGNGQFETLTPVVSIYAAGNVETGDLDGDGDADVVAANLEKAGVSVLLNQAGALAPPVAYRVAVGSLQLALLELVDLDADGDLDVATAQRTATSVSVLRNNGNGTFAPFAAYLVPNTTIDIAAGDVDGDGDVDLLVAHVGASPTASDLTLLLNNGTGVFAVSPPQSLGNVVTGFAIGDLDGDGDPDAVFSSSGLGGALLRFQNSGSGTFTFQQAVNIGSSSRNVLLADIDADGDLDALETALPDQIVICPNTNGVLQPAYTARTGQNPRDLRAADFDGDGGLDLATAGPAYAVSIVRNQGNGLFDPPILRASYGLATSIDPADLDGDGSMDIVVSNSVSAVISIVRACSNQVGSPYCAGDGSATACPCGNASAVGADAGCLHSLGSGGTLRASGYARLSADTLVLVGAGMPNSSALYFQGTSQVNGGAGAVFGDGLRCAGGTSVRLGTVQNASGASQYPSTGAPSVHVRGNVTVPGDRHYQVWYRNAATFCTSSTFNLTNGLQIHWLP